MSPCFPLALPRAHFGQQGCGMPSCTHPNHPCDFPQPSAKQPVNMACNLKTPPRGLSHRRQQMVSLTGNKSAVDSTCPTGSSAGAKPSCLGRLSAGNKPSSLLPRLLLRSSSLSSHSQAYMPTTTVLATAPLNGLLSVTNLGIQSPPSGLTTEGPKQLLFLILLFLVPTVITTPC